jgi:small subunit ribosomal protein S1
MFSEANEEESPQFSDMLEDSYNFVPPARGDIRDAEILEIRESEIVVDLGVKRDGIIPPQDIERLDPDFLESLQVGDIVPVYVLNPNDREGNLLVSLNLGLQGKDWQRARELLENQDVIEAEVTGYNRGGLLVRFGLLEGFVPASHTLDLKQGLNTEERREVMSSLIGEVIGLKVIEVNQGRRRLILSQREAQREWRMQQKKRLLDELNVGDVVTGQVTGIRDFGAFVDLGGADGLIHVSELAWHRVPHPSDVLEIGKEIEVYVLELDRDRQRIALSLRRTQPDPWEIVEQNYRIGQIVEGQVSNVVDFGAFVVLEDGIEGLLHISEMTDGTLVEPYSYLKRGDRVTVRIVRIEPGRRRIGFTQRDLGLDQPTDKMPPEMLSQIQSKEEEETDVDQAEVVEEADTGPPEAIEETDDGPPEAAEETDVDQAEVVEEADDGPPEVAEEADVDQAEVVEETNAGPPEAAKESDVDQAEVVEEADDGPPEAIEEADDGPAEVVEETDAGDSLPDSAPATAEEDGEEGASQQD